MMLEIEGGLGGVVFGSEWGVVVDHLSRQPYQDYLNRYGKRWNWTYIVFGR